MMKVSNQAVSGPPARLYFAILLLIVASMLSTACKSGYPVAAKQGGGAAEPRAVKLATVAELCH